ncbi:hypothetical protein L1987_12091 [Smallanthus sonchifolius]|uniref:Uncharacterized protein n=1 Tax=Smallanthus sonchifolius TaxID=185202 RepID=A0ACB9JD65_9ASTR|nr:hypothetical protein L1987_12091 [Smallanthus sonchifolius]
MERSKHLHNFNLPQGLSWGRQTLLRYMNVNPVRATPAVDDDESSDSGKYNKNRSIDNSRAEMEGIEIEVEENSPPLNSKSKQKLKAKASPPLKICSEGGADRGINAYADQDLSNLSVFKDVTPGLWLSEVHPDRYKVIENGKI